MATYRVTVDNWYRRDKGEHLVLGDEVSLTDDEAAEYVGNTVEKVDRAEERRQEKEGEGDGPDSTQTQTQTPDPTQGTGPEQVTEPEKTTARGRRQQTK